MAERILTSRKEIAAFVGRPWKTVKKWIKKDNFPAEMIDGRWHSEQSLIVEWMKKRIAKKCGYNHEKLCKGVKTKPI